MVKKKKNEEIQNEEVLSRIAENVKYLRKEVLRLKQEEMENHGFNYRFFQDIESGKHFPTLKTLLKLSKIFNVDIEDLVSKRISKEQFKNGYELKILNFDIELYSNLHYKIGHNEYVIKLNLRQSLEDNIQEILNKIPDDENLRLEFQNKELRKSDLLKTIKNHLANNGLKMSK